jgi:hypothetical protein
MLPEATAGGITIGAVPTVLAVIALIRIGSFEESSPGVGLFLILGGGVLMIVDALRGRLGKTSAA